jgi:hypothetical protein
MTLFSHPAGEQRRKAFFYATMTLSIGTAKNTPNTRSISCGALAYGEKTKSSKKSSMNMERFPGPLARVEVEASPRERALGLPNSRQQKAGASESKSPPRMKTAPRNGGRLPDICLTFNARSLSAARL